jgi:hypothetical protein
VLNAGSVARSRSDEALGSMLRDTGEVPPAHAIRTSQRGRPRQRYRGGAASSTVTRARLRSDTHLDCACLTTRETIDARHHCATI